MVRDYLKFIKINPDSMVPKCRQLAEAIIHGIKTGKVVKNDGLPSLHECSSRLEVSKTTVERAYKLLKDDGVVSSYRGKGYYIVSDQV